jgi:hypothetical protein
MKLRLKFLIFFVSILFSFTACKDSSPKKIIPITMNNAATIVTEVDSNYLKNIVEDISASKLKHSQQTATASLQRIDEDKKQDALANQTIKDNTLQGTRVELGEGAELMVAATNATVYKSGNKLILNYSGNIENMQLKASGISKATIQQCMFTTVSITLGGADYKLEDLPVSKGEWQNLPNNNNLFLSLNKSAYTYKQIDNKTIVLAADRALRKAGKSNTEIKTLLKELAKTNSANDAPCNIIFNSTQWKISGSSGSGKPLAKIIELNSAL